MVNTVKNERDYKLEVCCESLHDVATALHGGADRVELCAALSVGGVTPSAGMIAEAIAAAEGMPVTVLIRPREGDFVYSDEEVKAMVADIRTARQLGAAGIAVGALTSEGDINMAAMQLFVAEAKPAMEVTFNRAIDVCYSPEDALADLISLGCDRVLTSGGAATGVEGANVIASMVALANGRIEIVVGGGVRPDGIAALREATGACQFHSSARVVAGNTAPDLFGAVAAEVDFDTVRSLKANLAPA